MHEPKLLLADEPTGNLNEETDKSIVELLEENHLEGTTLILVFHDEELADPAHRQIRMADGLIL